MTVKLHIPGSTWMNSGQTMPPFVGKNIPFVGHFKPLILPFIGKKLPLVTNQGKQSAFTLIELIITLLVLGILSAIAAPAMRDIVMNNRIVTETNDMLVSLTFARSEAIKRSTPVFLCKTLDPEASPPVCNAAAAWTNGWLIFADANPSSLYENGTSDVLLRFGDGFPGTGNKIKLVNPANSFGFTRLGLLTTTGRLFHICDSRGNDSARVIDIFSTGRARVNRTVAKDCS